MKKLVVFISYAREDFEIARRLYDDLKLAGIMPWMDKADLLPGQNWKFHITKAIRESSYFIALLSSKALSKRGFVQKELKLALDILDEFSDEDVFLIPARLDDCEPADEKLKFLHWADLFPSYEAGRDDILRVFQPAKTDDDISDAVIQSVSEPERKETAETEKEFINSLSMKFVYIKPGTFMMGSPESEKGRFGNEILHKVTLTRGFYMMTTQVTQGQWKAVMGNNPSYFKNCDDCPIESVSWNDIQEFIKKLNEIEKTVLYRLPTEAEWEYSCRAGSETAYYFGDDIEKLKEYAWYGNNSGGKTHYVAQLKPNAWDFHDMHGNVYEWVQDWYGDYPTEPVTNPTGPDRGSGRVYRGGCWALGGQTVQDIRSACRHEISPDSRGNLYGFRLLRDAP